MVLCLALVLPLVLHPDAGDDEHSVVVGDVGAPRKTAAVHPCPVVVRYWVAKGDALESHLLAGNWSVGEGFGEVLGEAELLVVGVWLHVDGEEWPVPADVGDGALDVAAVVAPVNVLEGREVDVSVVGDHHPAVLLHKVGEVVPGPVVLHRGEVVGRVTLDGFTPVLIAQLVTSPQDKLSYEAEGKRDRL